MLKKLPLYPQLFTIFSAVFLGAYNVGQIPLDANLRPLIVSVLFSLMLYGLAQLFLRDWHRAALVALCILVMFFTYGQVYVFIKQNLGALALGHGAFLPWYAGVFIAGISIILWKVKNAAVYTFWLNYIMLILLIQPSYLLVVAAYQQWRIGQFPVVRNEPVTVNTVQPDIYYIVLDAYGREDILLNELGYDNGEFLDALRERGFYVAGCSRSNYAYTDSSLVTSLNYEYLDQLGAGDRFERDLLLKRSKIRSFLEANDYFVVAFPTGWVFTEWDDADLYLEIPRPATALTEYEIFLLNTTMVRSLEDVLPIDRVNSSLTSPRRLRAMSLLSNLGKLHEADEKLFVYAHLMLPHPPYSFTSDGDPSNFKEVNVTRRSAVVDAYLDQVKFVNREILRAIDEILMGSARPPVIILQGDHGPPPELSPTYREKMPILNAYYLPGVQTDQLLYPSISPVNSFRVVLNSYFGQDLPLLEDKSYYAPGENPDAYELVPGSCPEEP